jgi:hypothetical protein
MLVLAFYAFCYSMSALVDYFNAIFLGYLQVRSCTICARPCARHRRLAVVNYAISRELHLLAVMVIDPLKS